MLENYQKVLVYLNIQVQAFSIFCYNNNIMEEQNKKKQRSSMFGGNKRQIFPFSDDLNQLQSKDIKQQNSKQKQEFYGQEEPTISNLKNTLTQCKQKNSQQQKQTQSWFEKLRIFPIKNQEKKKKLEEKAVSQQPQKQNSIQQHNLDDITRYQRNQRSDKEICTKRDNYVKSQGQIPNESSINKYIKCALGSGIILAILCTLGLLAFLLVYFLYRPAKPAQSMLLFLPEYQKDQVYHINYTITNTMSEEYYLRINYTVYFVTAKIQQENGERVSTNFEAAMQKRSQQKINNNDTVEEVQFFDNSTSYNSILKYGISYLNNLASRENAPDQQENITCQQLQKQSNQSIVCNQPLLQVFNFTLLANGKIKQITFPLKMKKEEIGLLRTFIKMFSPLLDKKVYEDDKPQQQTKKLQSNPIFGDKLQSENSYTQISDYNYNISQDNISLAEKTDVYVQSDTQNTQQTASQQTIFQDGKPSSGSLDSQVSFSPKTEENDTSDNLFEPEPTEINANFTSSQTCQFKVVQTFTTYHLEQFAGILASYKEENKTLTTNVEGLINFVLQGDGEQVGQQMTPGSSRLLLEEDGSLKIIGYDKKVKLVKTNVIGFSIAAFGYFQLDIKMFEDQSNSLKKNIVFLSDVGTILSLGSKQYKYSLYEYRKSLPPLNLQFTLEQIQSAYNLVKGDFITNVIQLKNAIFSGRLEGDLLPKIGKILSVVGNLTTVIDQQASENSPIAKLNQIYSIIQIMWDAYQTKGMSLLKKDNQTLVALASGLLQYVNVSYEQALQLFQQSKNKLSQIQSNSITLFSGLSNVFLNQTLKQASQQIKSMITQQIYDQYNTEIQKVKIIFDMINYYIAEGKIYANNITQVVQQHKQDLLTVIKNVLDLYFQNQTTIAKKIEGQFSRYYEIQKLSYGNYASKLKSIVQIATKNSDQLFNSVLSTNLGSQQYRNNFTINMTALTNYANGASSQRFDGCCEHAWTWYGKKYCEYYNGGSGYQASVPTYWDVAKKISNESILNATKAVEAFVINITQLLQDSITVQQKFLKLQIAYYDSIAKYPLNKTLISNALKNCQSQAQDALNRVECGNTGNLRNFITMISHLQGSFSTYYQQYDQLNQTIFNVFAKFNTTIFTSLSTNAKLTVSTVQFMNKYIQQAQNIKNNFWELKKIAENFSPQSFVKNSELATQIFGKYQHAINKVDQLCQKNQTAILQINAIRQEYKPIISTVSSLSDTFFADQLTDLTNLIKNASVDMFQQYKVSPFCQVRQSFKDSLSTLYPDFDNFTILYRIWQNFTQIKADINQKLAKFTNFGNSLQGLFYQLFTPQGYDNFIKTLNQTSSQFIEQTFNLGMKLSHLKQESKNVLAFQTATQEQLKNAYKSFLDLQFSMDTQLMFSNMKQFTKGSFQAIKDLSFDVITVVVASKNVKQHFEQTVQNYKSGVWEISQQFKSICQDFIRLDKIASQNYLNQIDMRFKKIINIINETIFPNVSTGLQSIKNKYANYTFKNQKLKKVFTSSMNTLIQYTKLVDKQKKSLHDKFYQLYSQASQLINSLQIGSLNSLYELSFILKDSYQNYVSRFKSIISKVKEFPKRVEEDFRNLFKLDQYLEDIGKEVKGVTTSTSDLIKNKTKSKIEQIQSNSKFYKKLKESKYYTSISSVVSKGLEVDIKILWENSQIKAKLEQIHNIAKQISGNIQEFLEKLSETKQKIGKIKSSVQGKITNIKSSLTEIKRKIFNLQSLIFISLKGEITDVVMGNIKAISQNIDLIVTQDLASLGQLSADAIGVSSIKQLVSEVIQNYNNLKQLKDTFLLQMEGTLTKVDKFIQDHLSQKIQKLKDGALYIRSQANRQFPERVITLYRRQLWSRRAPIAKYFQIIPTQVGTFLLGLGLNYSLSFEVLIQLVQFRNINIGSNFSASLIIDVTFGYGIANILQFGLFVTGNLVRGDLKPYFLIKNAVPFQLVEAITGIEQFQKVNKIDIYFIVDLGLYAVQLTVGMYIKHIFLQLIWTTIRICIKFLFVKFCISFRIPIGFKITFKRHDFGYKIPGIVLAETRIVDLHLLSFKY